MNALSDLMHRALQLLSCHKDFYLITQRDRTVWMAENTRETITRSTMAALQKRELVENTVTRRGPAMTLTKAGRQAAK